MIGGVVAGVVFAMFEMMMAAILNGSSAFFMPLRMIGAMVLGKDALSPDSSLFTAGITGAIVHMVLSAMFGIVFGLAVALIPTLGRSTASLVGSASVYGLVIWIANFYVIAPIAGWDWFPQETNGTVQFFAHVIFFGSVLGVWLDRARALIQPDTETLPGAAEPDIQSQERGTI